ncbi:hypothetical protein P153DRAFT_305160 [Dothidotthia symphoricarpi CBS 119687]|uniref:Inheritance of peroxisomes protein 1 n=1 Tax=Dothidotthia symphoricarpi CBS 119687 TaxID=1392245 RepID=A0A6A6AUH2_9PLEO|nr:uncharacterized protein P153DRAFT_305160 [Dothidotthia symphoricarpi CBS 119687]KAF2134615.1 hypothetical protein P153DRAFT_305160 [Dothidotthia symphoricarpi CBS 119687]
MSSPAAPTTSPKRAASTNPRRAFTVPARIANRPSSVPPPSHGSDGIETLFICSSSKIVSFTAASPSRRQSPSRRTNGSVGASPSIAWKTPTERTLAVGILRIYRVITSNVSFLNSGNLLHTIFPRSQCWCVDDQSIFVLRIRQDSYYRIELPYETEEDKEKVAQLRTALDQLLQYEKTQCPFTRGFEDNLPERPTSPPRNRPTSRTPTSKAKKWLFDRTWVPEDGSRPSTPVESVDSAVAPYDDDDRSSIHTDTSETVSEVSSWKPPRRLSVRERAMSFQSLRSATMPLGPRRLRSVSSMQHIVESSKEEEKPIEPKKEVVERKDLIEVASPKKSPEPFYSLDESTPPTPFYDAQSEFLDLYDAHAELLNTWAAIPAMKDESRGRARHRRQYSESTVRAEPTTPITPIIMFHPSTTSTPSTPPLVSDSDEDSVELPGTDAATPPDAMRKKKLTGASQKRAFSPMPPSQALFRRPSATPTREFTNALVRKTCEIVLGPPAHLVSLMLRIAANMSTGFNFSTYGVQRAETAPSTWESSDEVEWPEEDDFGIPLNNHGEPIARRRTFTSEAGR